MKKRKKSVGLFFMYLFLILWAFTTVYPIIWVVLNSFKDGDSIVTHSFAVPAGEMFTTANYTKAFNSLNIFRAYGNSIFVSSMVVIGVIILAGMVAYALARYQFRGRKLTRILVVAAMMFPAFSTIIPVFNMEASWGIVNTDNWIVTMISVILPQIAGNMAFSIVILEGYIRDLPVELEEAAYVEGSSAFSTYFRVVVPLMKPAFATVGIFTFIWSYNDLFTQMFFLRRPEMRAITRLLNEITSSAGTDYGLLASAVTLVFIPLIIVYIFLQKYIIKGLTAGALKN